MIKHSFSEKNNIGILRFRTHFNLKKEVRLKKDPTHSFRVSNTGISSLFQTIGIVTSVWQNHVTASCKIGEIKATFYEKPEIGSHVCITEYYPLDKSGCKWFVSKSPIPNNRILSINLDEVILDEQGQSLNLVKRLKTDLYTGHTKEFYYSEKDNLV